MHAGSFILDDFISPIVMKYNKQQQMMIKSFYICILSTVAMCDCIKNNHLKLCSLDDNFTVQQIVHLQIL